MKTILILFAFILLLAGCATKYDPIPAHWGPDRTDLYHAYYLTSPTQVAETKGQVNLLWVGGLWSTEVAIKNMQDAQLPTVFDVSAQMFEPSNGKNKLKADPAKELRELFQTLTTLGLGKLLVAVTPIDEPNLTLFDVNETTQSIVVMKSVLAEFPNLAHVKLAVVYTVNGNYPEIDKFDWIGFKYGDEAEIFSNGVYASFKSLITDKQRLIIIPGGSFGQNPTEFFNWTQSHHEVVAIVSFLWSDGPGIKGIKNGPLRLTYCLMGQRILNPGKIIENICPL